MILVKLKQNIQNICRAKDLNGQWEESLGAWCFPDFLEIEIRKRFDADDMEWIEKIDETIPVNIDGFSFIRKPLKHQIEGFEQAIKYRSFAILDEMGLGKTKTAIDIARLRIHNGSISKILVMCPKAVMEVWKDEVRKDSNEHTVLLSGDKDTRLMLFNAKSRWFILNYEGLLVLSNSIISKIDNNWMIIFDEATKIKSSKAKRTKIAMKLSENTAWKLILSGKIITQTLLDIYCPYYIIDNGKTFGKSYYTFRSKFFTPGYKQWTWKPTDLGKEFIAQAIAAKSIRHLKKDCLDLPDKLYQTRLVDMDIEQTKIYKQMAEELLITLKDVQIEAKTTLTKLIKLLEITSGFIYDENHKSYRVSRSKIEALLDIIEETDEKIVIWCHFREDEAMLIEALKNYVVYVGDADSFQNDPLARIFIGKPQSHGMGITLTAANVVVYYSQWYSVEQREQSEDRTHRIGTKKNVMYYDLVCRGSIDVVISETLKQKRNLADEVLNLAAIRNIILPEGDYNEQK